MDKRNNINETLGPAVPIGPSRQQQSINPLSNSFRADTSYMHNIQVFQQIPPPFETMHVMYDMHPEYPESYLQWDVSVIPKPKFCPKQCDIYAFSCAGSDLIRMFESNLQKSIERVAKAEESAGRGSVSHLKLSEGEQEKYKSVNERYIHEKFMEELSGEVKSVDKAQRVDDVNTPTSSNIDTYNGLLVAPKSTSSMFPEYQGRKRDRVRPDFFGSTLDNYKKGFVSADAFVGVKRKTFQLSDQLKSVQKPPHAEPEDITKVSVKAIPNTEVVDILKPSFSSSRDPVVCSPQALNSVSTTHPDSLFLQSTTIPLGYKESCIVQFALSDLNSSKGVPSVDPGLRSIISNSLRDPPLSTSEMSAHMAATEFFSVSKQFLEQDDGANHLKEVHNQREKYSERMRQERCARRKRWLVSHSANENGLAPVFTNENNLVQRYSQSGPLMFVSNAKNFATLSQHDTSRLLYPYSAAMSRQSPIPVVTAVTSATTSTDFSSSTDGQDPVVRVGTTGRHLTQSSDAGSELSSTIPEDTVVLRRARIGSDSGDSSKPKLRKVRRTIRTKRPDGTVETRVEEELVPEDYEVSRNVVRRVFAMKKNDGSAEDSGIPRSTIEPLAQGNMSRLANLRTPSRDDISSDASGLDNISLGDDVKSRVHVGDRVSPSVTETHSSDMRSQLLIPLPHKHISVDANDSPAGDTSRDLMRSPQVAGGVDTFETNAKKNGRSKSSEPTTNGVLPGTSEDDGTGNESDNISLIVPPQITLSSMNLADDPSICISTSRSIKRAGPKTSLAYPATILMPTSPLNSPPISSPPTASTENNRLSSSAKRLSNKNPDTPSQSRMSNTNGPHTMNESSVPSQSPMSPLSQPTSPQSPAVPLSRLSLHSRPSSMPTTPRSEVNESASISMDEEPSRTSTQGRVTQRLDFLPIHSDSDEAGDNEEPVVHPVPSMLRTRIGSVINPDGAPSSFYNEPITINYPMHEEINSPDQSLSPVAITEEQMMTRGDHGTLLGSAQYSLLHPEQVMGPPGVKLDELDVPEIAIPLDDDGSMSWGEQDAVGRGESLSSSKLNQVNEVANNHSSLPARQSKLSSGMNGGKNKGEQQEMVNPQEQGLDVSRYIPRNASFIIQESSSDDGDNDLDNHSHSHDNVNRNQSQSHDQSARRNTNSDTFDESSDDSIMANRRAGNSSSLLLGSSLMNEEMTSSNAINSRRSERLSMRQQFLSGFNWGDDDAGK